MTRADFLARLKRGLVGLPTSTAADILNDYEAHFDDGKAAGRSEAEVASALGDPDRLARELKAEAGVKRWTQEQTPSAAAGAVFAVLGLGAIDIIILLPILMGVIGTLFGCFVAVVALFGSGIAVMVGALLSVATVLLVNGLIWFARLHYRLLKPALEPHAVASSGDPA